MELNHLLGEKNIVILSLVILYLIGKKVKTKRRVRNEYKLCMNKLLE